MLLKILPPPRKWAFYQFLQIVESVLNNKGKSAIPPLRTSSETLSSASDRTKFFEKFILRNLILTTWTCFYLPSLLVLI